MKLVNGTLRPGKVLEVNDLGIIKVSAPGLFSSEDDVEKLPPIMPFFSFHNNTYTSVKVDDEVWVLNFSDNPLQLYWFRKDNFQENNKDLINGETVEILCNLEYDDNKWASIYFNDGSGWIINRDSSIIQIRTDGSIYLNANDKNIIHVTDNGISLGKENKSSHPAARGDETKQALEYIYEIFNNIQQVSSSNPYTASIGLMLSTMLPNFKLSKLETKIESKNVTLE